MNKKHILFPAMAVMVLGVVTLGAAGVSAQNQADPQSSLITKIAQRFNLKESDVQVVFDEHHKEHHAQMQQKVSDRLSQLVTEGKLTEAQKEAILKKMEELRAKHVANREAMMNMTPEERREAMEKERAELEAWAKEQGIDLSLIKGFGMRMKIKGGHGFGHMRFEQQLQQQ